VLRRVLTGATAREEHNGHLLTLSVAPDIALRYLSNTIASILRGKSAMEVQHHADSYESQRSHENGATSGNSLSPTAWSATLHCLSGCAIGEVLGMVIGTALAWNNAATVALSVVLAFFFGYLLTLRPLLRQMSFSSATRLAFASDTASITVMEIVDNLVVLVIPGAMDAGITSTLFWASLVVSLAVAAVAAFPVNRWLISRGKGHAVVHAHHHPSG
jgi:hypothetical protein